MRTSEQYRLKVFLCHASEDKADVRDLYAKLLAENWIEPWLDEVKLLPGQNWKDEIEKAVEAADVVIAFLSSLSVSKEGYVQKELKYGLEIASEKPEETIFIIPLRLDDCQPPRRLRFQQYEDYFPIEQREIAYQRLLASLQLRLEQKTNPGKKEPPPPELVVIPTGARVRRQRWEGSLLPTMYDFVGVVGTPPVAHFFRKRDGHLATVVSEPVRTGEPFLIDKYAITCLQYCNFLNELSAKGLVQTTAWDGEYRAMAEGRMLAIDALSRWRMPTPRQPWLHATKPFGITYQSSCWEPVAESERLPVTLVSWWGARLYSLWAHDEPQGNFPESQAYLPSVDQWRSAATWDEVSRSQRRYPWGDVWNPQIVNFSGYWAGCNIREADWQSQWANCPLVHTKTRPIGVGELEKNTSPCGCVQMLGNTWEWMLAPLDARQPIQGGSAISPMEYCEVGGETRWPIDKPDEYIGFRCCHPVRRPA